MISKFFSDLLKTKDLEKGDVEKYSQSRVYLMISFVFSLIVSFYALYTNDVDNYNLTAILNHTFNIILVFVGAAIYKNGSKTLLEWKKVEEGTAEKKSLPKR